MLILTKYVAKHEFKPLTRFLSLADILDGARKVAKGLAIETKPPQHLPGYRFFKVRIGQRDGARMIVFMVGSNSKVVPVLIRLKKDKVFGENMAMNNSKVVSQIRNNLANILTDIKNQNYEEFPL